MLPAQWVELDALPLNANGKVDRKQLTDKPLAWMGTAPAMAAPRTPTEAALYPIWAEVLGVAQFGVDDDFFSLGGHSLLATYVISRIRAAFTVELPLKALFEHPTVAQLAAVIASCAAAPAAMPTIAQQSRPARIPLSFAQQRLWFVEQLNPGSSQFNVPIAIRLLGAVDPVILEGSFCRLLERHEVLRTAFGVEDGVPCQRIEAQVGFELPLLDYRALSTSGREQAIKSLLREEFDRPFDLARAPLLRARLIQLPDQEHLLALTLHHLVSDGWSATLVLRELAEAYAALQGGRAPEWPALPIQYADFALWQRSFMQGAELERQLAYWKKAVSPRDGSDTDYLLTLPTDRPRPAVQSYASGLLSVKLSSELSDRIRAFASRQKQSPFSLVFAAFAALLHRMSGQHHLVLGTPMSNRRLAETEHMLGILLNNLAIAADFSADPTFAQLARQVSDSLLEAQEHQDLPFEHLVDQLALPRSLSHAPLFQVMVAQQLNVEERVRFPGIAFEVLPTDLNHSEYDLDLHIVAPVKGPFELGLMYAHDLFEQTTAEGWLDRFVVLLERLLDNPAQRVAA
ncbi:MAG TPA: condensation domain-containing protein, partial [Pseudoxanthomonas sp.]|nr:condensation domain-containing protein [Pseudoxanthomonas sp.]